ncbi:hypothetical protein [Marinifilum caeruleilacunae]|uniref:Protease complex subunit PrcB family protein n=1 Tax=Marinifilum caeruleilacunae TaxID=2499076 RepID=A0ABX1WYU6_9BACT|nr:hypothetical protein [Marinifilum caeruleilacunae]NOU61069.1 hypothetical protein [Marinifilum caeruleilacunae]
MRTRIMKTAFQYFLCFSCLALFLSACSSSSDEELEEINFLKFTDFECEDPIWDAKSELSDTYRVVNSNEELDEYITINCIPQIDYSKYMLIIGEKSYSYGNTLYSQKVEENNNSIVYTVIVLRSFTTVATSVQYHAIIERPRKQKEIEVVLSYFEQ